MAVAEQSVPLSAVVVRVFSPEFLSSLIDRVLAHRARASGGVRKGLDAAIDESIELRGFSKHPSKAQPARLKEPLVVQVMKGNDRLTGEVLRTWAESHKELQARVEGHLKSLGAPVDGPNRRDGVFNAIWTRAEWSEAVGTLSDVDPSIDSDDVGMMVCYVSGMAVAPAVTSPLLSSCLDRLEELPASAPDWEEIDAFVRSVRELEKDVAIERAEFFAERFHDTLDNIQTNFADELEYLEVDVGAWAEQAAGSSVAVVVALDVVEELRLSLLEYCNIRPQAATKKEEETRAKARAEREAAIFALVAKWERTLANAEANGDSEAAGTAGQNDAPADAEAGATNGQDAAAQSAPAPQTREEQEEHEALRADLERLEGERGWFRDEIDRLQTERDRLAQANTGLAAEKESLGAEIGDLRAKFAQSRDLGKYWRRFYTAFAQVGNVDEAVARAEELFPKQLLFALNSKSNRDIPFQKPAEALAAFVWLATDYHHVRWVKPGEDPGFDERLRKFCPGWKYRPHQSNVTKQQFADWYTTRYEGRPYEIGEHLTKGNSRNPQNTIRIAFAWDDERSQVVVGYVGLHQRNRGS